MTEKNEILTDQELNKVSGGYMGNDRFSTKGYKQAGITWESNVFSKDTYTITENGQEKNITQAEAEKIAFDYHGKYENRYSGGGRG